ncbi:FAD-dependent monooxygenase [Lachnellula subtilissima]|uniref:FAD-dependent monooxygenase n=1 Tax=Lachnellula subtilissima TaxID=602034 RepID=A0A8H8RR82_9HELO|nr:FAD-dependent monooxygenase [Lachnellula subtilissima]
MSSSQPSLQGAVAAEIPETLPSDTVLIVGGGPVGLLLATVLAFYGVKSLLLERNETTTKWPKMDLTNARSMEIFRKLGLADGLREKGEIWQPRCGMRADYFISGVPSNIPYTVLFSSGLSRENAITQWWHPSVDECRKQIRTQNDGTKPLEPYQRISQAIFEAWLKESCDTNPLIDLRYGNKVETVQSEGEDVKVTAVNSRTGKKVDFISRYVAGCDGSSSKVRTGLGIPLDGGPVPGFALLVHFKSKDLARLQKQGQFWHIFFVKDGEIGGAIIAQDEVDTWTTHLFLPLDADHESISSEEAVYSVLGGMGGRYEIKIDEIIVRSTYRPNVAVSRSYSALNGRVFLAGDSAHQNIPTGGYGMNMGIADAYDLGWKLSAVINGHGKRGLLDSYELERRPVASLTVEHSKVHSDAHGTIGKLLLPDATVIDHDTKEGEALREKIGQHYQEHDGENKDLGIEMGFQYKSPINIPDDDSALAPVWTASRYIPTTWPGVRAPHVFLNDGTPIFDHFGKDYTLIEFPSTIDLGSKHIMDAAKENKVPLKHVVLPGEDNAFNIWGKHLVLARPDGHVAWRSNMIQDSTSAKKILNTILGTQDIVVNEKIAFGVSGSGVVSTQREGFVLEKMGDLQK